MYVNKYTEIEVHRKQLLTTMGVVYFLDLNNTHLTTMQGTSRYKNTEKFRGNELLAYCLYDNPA